MKANELRIGNHIYNGVITEIGLDYFKFNDGYQTWDSREMVEGAIEPLPLTEESLVRFGFYVDKNKAYINFGELQAMFHLNRINNDFEFTWGAIPIKSVHHLQNLYFYLVGEELTLKTETQ